MKKLHFLFLLVSTTIFGQNFNSDWDKVIAFENEDKIKSASEIVDDIYKKAIRNDDEVQIIKCFFYKSKYLQRVDENAQNKIIIDLTSKIKKISIPSKAILNLVYAKCLENYSQRYNYDLQRRTKIDSTASKNFKTWTSQDFYYEIDKAYKESLENENDIKNISIEKYEQIFDFLSIEKFKRTTVLEYVLQENINHYKINGTSSISSIMDEVYKSALLGNSGTFVNLKLDSLKSDSARNIVALFQKLEQKPTFEKEFERIKFMNESFNWSNENYQKALLRIQKYAIDAFLLQKILFEKATYLYNQASKLNPINKNFKTIEVLDSILNIKNRSNKFTNLTK